MESKDGLKIPELTTIAILLLVLVLLVVYYFQLQKPTEKQVLTIGSTEIEVEIANTPILRSQGLSDRDALSPDKGMLFIFENPEIQRFWMKGMRFPLDVIWISNGRVVGVTQDIPIPYDSVIPQMSSELPVEWVLEVNAGFVDQNGVKIGDSVKLN